MKVKTFNQFRHYDSKLVYLYYHLYKCWKGFNNEKALECYNSYKECANNYKKYYLEVK